MEDKKITKPRLQCQYFIKKKNRQCGMTRSSLNNYCSEHLNLYKLEVGNNLHNPNLNVGNGKEIQDQRKRIPCPLDPKHTVWENQLNKHMKKCNKFKLIHSNDDNIFYCKDLNRGQISYTPNETDNDTPTIDQIVQTAKVLLNILDSNYFNELSTRFKNNKFMNDNRLKELSNQKHALQQGSLIQNLFEYMGDLSNENNSNDTSKSTIIEFGCGKAEFSRYLNNCYLNNSRFKFSKINPPNFILIDRASNRLKFDSKIIKDTLEITKNIEPKIDRIRIDIKDLKLDAVVSNNNHNNSKQIVISKHLCGVATDLTLRCLVNSKESLPNLNSMVIAMCCRHVCQARDYINPDFIKILIKQFDCKLDYNTFFSCLKKICSWATNGRRHDVQDMDKVTVGENDWEITVKQREQIGLCARRIIDQGRLIWVKENLPNRNVELIKYCPKNISLENCAIILNN